jgi:hypothetical protein
MLALELGRVADAIGGDANATALEKTKKKRC